MVTGWFVQLIYNEREEVSRYATMIALEDNEKYNYFLGLCPKFFFSSVI